MSLALVQDAARGTQLPVHPAAEIFPRMSDAEFNALVVDILANGLRDPIVLCDGAILDGRHRARACAQAGVALKTVEWDRVGTAEAFVVSRNLHRRHLNESQRAMVAAKLATLTRGNVAAQTGGRIQPPHSIGQSAALLNVGPSSVKCGKTVLARGTAAEIAAVETGAAAVSAVARQIKQRQNDAPMDTAPAAAPAPTAAPPAPERAAGGRLTVPDGTTPEQLCREAMARESAGASPDDAADSTGIAIGTYRKMRDIVMLADRNDLTPGQRSKVTAALRRLNEHRQIGPAHAMVADLVARVWGEANQRKAKTRDQNEARRVEAFERGLGAVAQTCAAFTEIAIPYLAAERARSAAATLDRAIEALRQVGRAITESN